jgi:hypothetical protein
MRRFSAYRVFLTRKTEYHIRGHQCFGVRDRRTGQWAQTHWALGQRLATACPDPSGKLHNTSLPAIGDRLCFVVEGTPTYTSAVIGVEEREQYAIGGLSPVLHEELARRPPGPIRETY